MEWMVAGCNSDTNYNYKGQSSLYFRHFNFKKEKKKYELFGFSSGQTDSWPHAHRIKCQKSLWDLRVFGNKTRG